MLRDLLKEKNISLYKWSQISELPYSTLHDLLNGKKSDALLEDIDENRVRRYLYYEDYDDMYEQTLDGHAWESDKLINTGKRYKR